VIDNKELAKYLRKRMESQDEVNTVFHLIKVPTEDELEYYIQQYKIKEGHSEWSETYKRNFWVEDED
jgi:NAD(P)H-dependent FMN reductase